MIPLAPVLGGPVGVIAGGVISSGIYDLLKGEKGGDTSSEEQGETGLLARLFGLPTYDPSAAKKAITQSAVIVGLIILFFVGLVMFVGRSSTIKAVVKGVV